MTDIYEKFDKATGNISAYALLWQGKPVGRIVIKFGAAATAYVQIWGAPMSSARATGYGYDKVSVAVMAAIARMNDWPSGQDEPALLAFARLQEARTHWNGSTRFTDAIERAGLTIANVI